MSSTHSSGGQRWFFDQPLREQFSQDIKDALAAERISEQQSLWLATLLDEPHPEVTLARVDQLVRDDQVALQIELASAWLITDLAAPDSDVFFSSMLDGLQHFANRSQWVAYVGLHYGLTASDLAGIEYQRVEGNLFQQRMRVILDQQVRQRQQMIERLQRLPILSVALGQTLQRNIDALMPGTPLDVFTHLVLIEKMGSSEPAIVLGSQSMADLALQNFAGTALPGSLRRQWLDGEGRALSEQQASLWRQALADVSGALVGVFEALLSDYWLVPDPDTTTRRQLAVGALAECFRQHLLAARHEAALGTQAFDRLKSLCVAGEDWQQQLRVSRLSLAIGSQEPIKLAGVFMMDFSDGQVTAFFLYSARRGLRRFTDVAAIAEHFAGIDGRVEALEHSSLNDQWLLRTHGPVHLGVYPVSATPLQNILDSIISLQKRDLAFVLRQSFQSPAEAMLRVGVALNVFALFDPALATAGQTGRWSAALIASEQQWSAFSAPARRVELDIQLSKASDRQAAAPWIRYLMEARNRLQAIYQARPSAADCACRLLNDYLSSLSAEPVEAQRMWIRDEAGTVVSLSVLLLEQVSGLREPKVAHDCEVYIDPVDSAYSQYLPWLTPDLLDHVLERARQAYAQAYLRLSREVHSTQALIADSMMIPAHASRAVREGALRLAVHLQRNDHRVSEQGLQMLEQALDRPVYALRQVFGFQTTEVFVPMLVHDRSKPPIVLTNTLVLQQPLHGDARPLLWSALLGLREFDSLAELQLDLKARLAYPASREHWLGLIDYPDRDTIRRVFQRGVQPQVSINLARIEGDFLAALDLGELQRQYRAQAAVYQTAVTWRVNASLFENMLASTASDDKARAFIDQQSVQLELHLLSEHIPPWLSRASLDDLWHFRQLVVRFGQLYSARKSVPLIATLDEYATDQVQERLSADYPDQQLDPQLIAVTLTRYTPTPGGTGEVPSSIPAATVVISESLSNFAINRFSRYPDAILSVAMNDGTPLPEALDASYVSELVRALDVGAGYERYLAAAFDEKGPDHAARLSQFIEQAPYALLLMAFRLKLQGKLSNTGYDFIDTILRMPDGLARLPLKGQSVCFSPLRLIAGNGSAAGFVRAVYLITPADQSQGPWILHAPAEEDFLFKEYAGQSAFLDDLKTSSELQAMLNIRLDPALQLVYTWAGTVQPALTWGSGGLVDLSGYRLEQAQLVVEPMQGNVLHSLFRATEQVMLINARRRSVSTAQDDSAQNRFLVGLGVEQALMFLPGRMGGLIGLLQARDLLNASLASASEKNWGEATAEFTAALALLIASHQQREEADVRESKETLDDDEAPSTHWHDPLLQGDPTASLLPFESHDVSLRSLQHDEILNVFQDPITLKQYTAVLGKVYQVRSGNDGWCVVRNDDQGPLIKRDADNHWTLDTDIGERRGGAALTSMRTGATNRHVEDVFEVQASGMAEIESRFPQKAIHIRQAHAQARLYLENALYNLTLTRPQSEFDPRTVQILKDFFGVPALGNISVLPIKQALADIYLHLVDPSLSPYSSTRYVAGTNKHGYEHTNAFIFAKDPQQRIFLTERFFSRPPFVRLKPLHIKQGSFNPGTHYRATTLIHEISHIANVTHDIAYLNANLPFLDLIDDTGTYRARMKLDYEKSQNNLSHLASREELFRVEEDGWRDFQESDGAIKNAILDLTGAMSLESARDKFIHEPRIRARVMLSNADSVALLATLLGRELFITQG